MKNEIYLARLGKGLSMFVNNSIITRASTKLLSIKLAVIFVLLASGTVSAQDCSYFNNIDVELTTGPYLPYDSNKPDDPESPTCGYIGFRITNNSGATIPGLNATLNNFVYNPPANSAGRWALAGDQPALQYVGTLDDGESDVVYWYVTYPYKTKQVAPIPLTVDVTVSDIADGSCWFTYTENPTADPDILSTKPMLSSDGGGSVISLSTTGGVGLGSTLEATIVYNYQSVDLGADIMFQPSGFPSFNAGCAQLYNIQVVSVDPVFEYNPSNGYGVNVNGVDNWDLMYFQSPTQDGGNTHQITVKFYYRIDCIETSTSAYPWAANTSGQQDKYRLDIGYQIDIDEVENNILISKSVEPTVVTGGETVKYTIAVTNNSTDFVSLDRVVDMLPDYISFVSMDPSSDVNVSNSNELPINGQTGTISFIGGVPTATPPYLEYYLDGGETINVVFNALVSTSAPTDTYTNQAYYKVGITDSEITTTDLDVCALITLSAQTTNMTNCSSPDGSITISTTGPGSSFDYSLDGSNWQTSNTFSGLNSGTYNVYVREHDNNQCTNNIEVVVDSDIELPDPPVSGDDEEICEGNSNPQLSVTVGAGETADWYTVTSGGTPFLNNSLTYTPAVTIPGTYTYYVSARNTTTTCESSSRTPVTLVITERHDAGSNGSLEVCEGETSLQNFFNALGGSPDSGGAWNDDDNSGVTVGDGTSVDLSGLDFGTYNFTYSFAASGSCPEVSATLALTVTERKDAGSNGSLEICEGETSLQNFFDALGGAPDSSGAWNDDDNSGVTVGDGTSVDLSGLDFGTYNFTYSFDASGSCPEVSATLALTVTERKDAGSNGTLEVCEGETSPQNFFDALGGAPDSGGAWNDDDNSGVLLGDGTAVDVSGLDFGTYNYTYSFDASGSCPEVSATLALTVTERKDAGSNGTLEVCEGETSPQNFFDALGGAPDSGGAWNDDDNSGVLLGDGTAVDVSGLDFGTYNYTYSFDASGSCPEVSATLALTVTERKDAGSNGTLEVCEGETSLQNFFVALGGIPDIGGNWFDNDNSGVLLGDGTAVDVSGLDFGTYNYTYSFDASGSCPEVSATLALTVTERKDAGSNGTLEVCEGETSLQNFFVALGGIPDIGGNWFDNDNSGVTIGDGTAVDVSGLDFGTYNFTYSFDASGSCPEVSATLTLTVTERKDAGSNGSLEVCEGETSLQNFFNALGGSPDSGGAWNDDDNSGVTVGDGTSVDVSGLDFGTYNFTYSFDASGSCPEVSATLALTVTERKDAGSNGSLEICEGETSLQNFFVALGGAPDSGGAWNDDDNSGVLLGEGTAVDVSGLDFGTYNFTYSFDASGSCPEVSVTLALTVTERKDAGGNGSLEVCEGETSPQNFFDALGGAPDSGGAWNDDDNSGVLLGDGTAVDVSGLDFGTYNFTYSFDASGSCPEVSATLALTVTERKDAGSNGSLEVCEGETSPQNFFIALGGAPDSGGAWNDDDNSGITLGNGTAVDVSGLDFGTYNFTYMFDASGSCPEVSATLALTVTERKDAGSNGSLEVCEGVSSLQNFFIALGGIPDIGGNWFDNDNSGVTIGDGTAVDVSGLDFGTYNFTYSFAASGSCPEVSATLTLTITERKDAGSNGTLEVCEGESSLQNFFDALGGAPDSGGAWNDDDNSGVTVGDGTSVDLSGLDFGTYNFTYMFDASGSCPEVSATLALTVTERKDAGSNGSLEVCEGESSLQNFFAALGGSPNSGGNWLDNDNSGVTVGDGTSVDLSGLDFGTYNFTYMFDASGSCPEVSATLALTVTERKDAGSNGTLEVCEGETSPQNFFDALGGAPDSGGAWNDDDNSGITLGNGTSVDVSGLDFGTYNFTYMFDASGSCPEVSATLALTVTERKDAGSNGTLEVCEGETSLQNFFNALGGSPDSGGAWNDDDNSGVTVGDGTSVDLSGLDFGTYNFTYSFDAIGSCPEVSATLALTVTERKDAGSNGTLEVCEGETSPQNFFDALGGAPDSGGAWNDDDNSGVTVGDGTSVDLSGLDFGTYNFTYSFDASGSCPEVSATLALTVTERKDAGSNGTLEVCEGESSLQNFFVALGGAPDSGGAWNDDDNSGITLGNGTAVDVSGLDFGTYNFTYMFDASGSCPEVSATLALTVTERKDAGSNGSLEVCEGVSSLQNFFIALGGIPDIGGNWFDNDNSGVTIGDGTAVDVSGLDFGTYNFTYSFAASGSCPEVSATLTLTITERKDAGSNGTLEVCEGESSLQNFFDALGGAPDSGGAWNDDDNSGVTVGDGTSVDLSGLDFGTYNFTYMFDASGSCPEVSATLALTVTERKDAGSNGTLEVCEGESSLQNFFAALGGSPNSGGNWLDNDNSGVTIGDGTAVDVSGLDFGTYNFTYSFDASGSCPEVSATLTLTVTERKDAGSNGTLEVCEGESSLQNFFIALGGAPDSSGAWNDDDNSGITLGNGTAVDVSGLDFGTYNFTYMFDASGSCPEVSATLALTVTERKDAGSNGSLEVCEGVSSLQNFFIALGGIPDIGGNWFDNDNSGVTIGDGTAVDVSGLDFGTYNFTYMFDASGSCPEVSATLALTVTERKDAGSNGTLEVCEGESSLQNFFAALGGSPNSGGNWLDNDNSGVTIGDGTAVDVSGLDFGTYNFTYSFDASGSCPEVSATLTLTVTERKDAGSNGTLEVCEGESSLQNFFIALGGAPDSSGAWNDDDNSGVLLGDGTAVDVSGLDFGTYNFTYMFDASGSCPEVSATLTLTVTERKDAGSNGTLEVCEGESSLQNFFIALGGAPDSSGAWNDDDNSGVLLGDGTAVDVSGLDFGTYNFTYMFDASGSCPEVSATLALTVIKIDAINDIGIPINGFEGGVSVPDVLVNDLLNGLSVNPSEVTLSQISADPGLSLNTTTREVSVAPGTPAGNYELVYKICETLKPSNCDQATVFVEVTSSNIIAVNDTGDPVNGFTGGLSENNVLWNDFLNGNPVNPADVTLVEIIADPGLSLITLTGEVFVDAGTPAGDYELVYEICEILNPSNCDQATVFVEVIAPDIIANDDTGDPVNGFNGGVSEDNVLDNDLLNGAPFDPADITLSQVSAHQGLSLNVTTGEVSVASGTPAGDYVLVYEICEVLNPANCDEAAVYVTVTESEIIANDDFGDPVNGFTGGVSEDNVLENDLLDGDPVDPANITLSQVSAHQGLSLNVTTGEVSVAPGTPAGDFVLVYEICEVLNPANCDEAAVYVTVTESEIIANDDFGDPVNGFTGGVSEDNVLDNDLLDGDPVDPANITLSQVSAHQGLSLNVTTGEVSVAPGTPAGDFVLVYEICEVLNPANCDEAAVYVTVTESEIIANDDFGDPVNGSIGGVSEDNVLDNDLLNGDPVDPADITLSQVSAHQGLSLNVTSGEVSVASGTPAGDYVLVYEICEVLNPANCDEAAVYVTVTESEIIANDDFGDPVNGSIGGVSEDNVLDNDLLNGSPFDPADITLSQVSAHQGLSLNVTSGEVSVAPGTPAGDFVLVYEICEVLNPTNCDEAAVYVTVTESEIIANDDFGDPVNGFTGGISEDNVLDNDLLNGSPVDPADITLSQVSAHQGLSLNVTSGEVSVAPGTPAGDFVLVYEICEVLNPANCDEAAVYVTVTESEIIANDDFGDPVNGFTGGISEDNVLDNDLRNGDPVDPADITLSLVSADPGLSLNNLTGEVSVATGTAAGNYELVYKICEILNPTNCDQATVFVTVIAPEIIANDDFGDPINGSIGGVSEDNVLENDLLNGSPFDPADVTLSKVSAHQGLSLNVTSGEVSVAPGTPAGDYVLVYEICEVLNPTNCDEAAVYVTVTESEIIANDDFGDPINGSIGGVSEDNVLENDLLNGSPFDLADIALSQVSAHQGLSLNVTSGEVSVAPGTPAGDYVLVYKICEVLNPTNCDEAAVYVTVTESEIIANDDFGDPVNGSIGGVSEDNVLENDLLNGSPFDPADITLSQVSAHQGLSLNVTSGEVSVAPGTPAGDYVLVYEICEVLNPANCDEAAVYVTVIESEIIANDDFGDPVNGSIGGVSEDNVLDNDLLNGDPVDPADITLSQVSAHQGLSLNVTSGEVSVASGTPAGDYVLVYEICEVLNPANCDEAAVYVTVTESEIIANDDFGDPVNGSIGGVSEDNVLDNDLLNGSPFDPADITLSQVSAHQGLSLNVTSGEVSVAPGTPAGDYVLVYEICEVLNPANCDEAAVYVTVTESEIIANDDFGDPVNGSIGGVSEDNVLDNDLLNGSPFDPADITLSQVSAHQGLSLNVTTGEVSVALGTPAGDFVLVYEICEVLNPANCDEAAVYVTVIESEIIANDDFGDPVNGSIGGVSEDNVLDNDLLNGDPVDPADITLSQVSAHQGLSLNVTSGEVSVASGTPAGDYVLVYEICEVLNPANCDEAAVYVTVTESEIIANDDFGDPVNGSIGGVSEDNVLDNDLLNGSPFDPADITLSQVSAHQGLSLNVTSGEVSVAPGTPAGDYVLVYEICEILNPANCDQATVFVTVVEPEIIANDDFGDPVNGFTGGISEDNVLDNDLLNGSPVDPADITLSLVSTDPGLSLNNLTGEVSVASGTPAGDYVLVYEICEILNPANCDEAAVYVTVTESEIIANDDFGDPVNGFTGGISEDNVLENDLLNGSPVDPADITLSLVSTDPALSLNNLTGEVSVAPGTAAGNYELFYEICEMLNPTNCDQATVFVTVVEPEIIANDDTGDPVNGYAGGISVLNVLVNDLLSSNPAQLTNVIISEISSDPELTFDTSTGKVGVASGTPAGDYYLVYEICETLNPGNCDQATVTVPVTSPIINAKNDYGTPVNGNTGGISVIDVLVNDFLNLSPVNPAEITISEIDADPGISLNTTTRQVIVAPGTPAGMYLLVYEICEILNPGNCDQATVYLTVTTPNIVANDDTGNPVNGYTGGISEDNVINNDLLNGSPVDLADVTLSQITADPGLALNNSTGEVNVGAGTPAGDYQLVYEICEILNPSNCDQATVFVTVTEPDIVANNDNGIPVNGVEGGVSVPNVLVNDLLNGNSVNFAEITLTQTFTDHPGINLNTSNGQVSVAPGTPVGPHNLVYQICEILNPGNCDQAVVTVLVQSPEITANDDYGVPVYGFEGGPAVNNVLDNDEFNGNPVNPADIVLFQVNSTHPGIMLNSVNGKVIVAPRMPAGNYELIYSICELQNPSNCDQATVFVEVLENNIVANDDYGNPVNGFVGGVSEDNVLENDRINGYPINAVDVSLIEITADPGLSLDNNTGKVSVSPGIAAGNYELVYEICEILNPANCDQATVFVTVTPPEIIANNDIGVSVDGNNGGVSVDDVLENDLLNGFDVEPAKITLTELSADPGLTLDVFTGEVSVAPGTPAGNYQLIYEICEILNPGNCDQATVFVEVTFSTILANDDTGDPVNGYDGGVSEDDVMGNDLLNGNPVNPADVTLSAITADPGLYLNTTSGEVSVAAGTPAGNYELVYEICEILNPANCDQATVFVTVTAPDIVANDDIGDPVNGFTGGVSEGDVLGNDLLNGSPVNPADVTLSVITADPGLSLNTTSGDVSVAAGTPAGNYQLVYQICEILNPANCDQAIVFVTVTPPQIIANNDTGDPVNSYDGGVSEDNVLGNDLLNGSPVNPADVTLSVITADPGLSLNTTSGDVSVAAGTPAGNYQLVYQICEILNPANCDQATVFVTVTPPQIIANNDTGDPVNSYDGGVSEDNVLGNDLLNGSPVNPAEVILSEITADPGLSLNTTSGEVSVAAGTPAGNYQLVYQICEILNPANCDQGTVFVTVTIPLIIANDDMGDPVNEMTGGISVQNVLINDMLNGMPVTQTDVMISFVSCSQNGISLSSSCCVTVAAGTPAGNYELVYEICDILNPTNCDQATVTVPVAEDPEVDFCINGYPAIKGSVLQFCSSETINFSLCEILSGVPPFDICWEINGEPDCENDLQIGDALFIQTFTPGTYLIQITSVKDDTETSVSNLASYYYTIEVVPGANANAGGNAIVCEGLNHVLSQATASGYTELLWTGGDGIFVPSAEVLNPMYIPGSQDVTDGTVELCLTATPELPCTTPTTDCMILTVQPNVAPDAGPDITVCETAGFVELNGIVENGFPVWETTSFTGGFFEDPNSASTNYYFSSGDIQLGTIELCLTGIPDPPCFIPQTDCINVTIVQSPEADAGPDQSICEGESALLNLASVENTTATEWTTNGDGTFSDPALVNALYFPGDNDNTEGEVQLCLTAYPLAGCTNVSINCMRLDIIHAPGTNLSPERELDCSDYDVDNGNWLPVYMGTTVTGDYESIIWTTDGDGTFDDPSAESPSYFPGVSDNWVGDVEICVNIESAGNCQFNISECITLSIPQQLIYFHKNGWWGISSYLETDLETVPEVMDPLVLIPGSQHLINIVDKTGKYFWAEPIPTQATLGDWMPAGYKLKVKNTPACLPIYGDSLTNRTFYVDGSFTYLPTLTNVPVSIDSLFKDHTDDILLIYHWSANQLWTPVASDFDSIYPGYSYLLVSKIGSDPYSVYYPHFVPDAPHLYPVQVPKDSWINNSPWAEVESTALPHIFLFANSALDRLSAGDILGAFNDDGTCYGMAEYGNNEELYKLVAMGNNRLSSKKDGFSTGDKIQFRIYNIYSGEEYTVSFILDEGYPSSDGNFSANSVSRVVDIVKSVTSIGISHTAKYTVGLYPNPTKNRLNITSNEEIETVKIMNSVGQEVIRNDVPGRTVIIDVSKLNRGMYIVLVKHIDGKLTIRRVTIQ